MTANLARGGRDRLTAAPSLDLVCQREFNPLLNAGRPGMVNAPPGWGRGDVVSQPLEGASTERPFFDKSGRPA